MTRAVVIAALAGAGLALLSYLVLRYVGGVPDKEALTGAVVIGTLAAYQGALASP